MSIKLGACANQPGDATTYLALEAQLGRKLAITRHYFNWYDRVGQSKFLLWSVAQGKLPIVMWHPFVAGQNGGPGSGACTWSDITAGIEDDLIRQMADDLRALGVPVLFGFHHEPEDDIRGNAAQAESSLSNDYAVAGKEFRLAWNHVKKVMKAQGVPLVRFGVCLMAPTYGTGHGGIINWMPAGAEFFAVDGYNRGGVCAWQGAKWRTFEDIFAAANAYAVSHVKDLYIEETGCPEGAGTGSMGTTQKAQWFTDMGATLKSWPAVKGISYSNVYAKCDNRIDTSPGSLAAFKAVANDPYLGG